MDLKYITYTMDSRIAGLSWLTTTAMSSNRMHIRDEEFCEILGIGCYWLKIMF